MRQISFLIKPTSSICNLRCRYCFYEDEAASRSMRSMGIMSAGTADRLLASAFGEVEPGGSVSFAFQGGEPTVAGLEFFRHFTENARHSCPKDVSLDFSIQTNGMAIEEDWAAFLSAEDFLVGLSIDGTKDLHELYRVDPAGKGSWNRVTRALSLLQKHKARVNALCVVTEQCAKHPEQVYRSLKKLGFGYIQFIPCLDPLEETRGGHAYSLRPETYGTFLCRCFDLWHQDWKNGNYCSVRLFDDYIHLLIGDDASTCATCGRCGSYFVVEGDGSVYPCDFYVLDDWKLGVIGEQSLTNLAENEVHRRFLDWGREKPAECASCRWRPLCNSGCKRDWEHIGEGERNYFCPAFKTLFAHAEPRMLEIARAEVQVRRRAGLPGGGQRR